MNSLEQDFTRIYKLEDHYQQAIKHLIEGDHVVYKLSTAMVERLKASLTGLEFLAASLSKDKDSQILHVYVHYVEGKRHVTNDLRYYFRHDISVEGYLLGLIARNKIANFKEHTIH